MPIVTLISDWAKDDYYSASVKGKILDICPHAVVVDISNQVPAFNIALAAFMLKNSYKNFPGGSIHIIAVHYEGKEKSSLIGMKVHEHYFISYDNGIFGLLLEEEAQEVVLLSGDTESIFPELDVFAVAAGKLLLGKSLSELGTPCEILCKQVPMLPAIDHSLITGSVIYIDSYRNAITNISRDLFEQIGHGRPFEIFVQSNHNRINQISRRYGETSRGELLGLFNSVNLLEIAINGGNAADLLNISLNSSVRIKFKEPNS
jgi:hypothetical protein